MYLFTPVTPSLFSWHLSSSSPYQLLKINNHCSDWGRTWKSTPSFLRTPLPLTPLTIGAPSVTAALSSEPVTSSRQLSHLVCLSASQNNTYINEQFNRSFIHHHWYTLCTSSVFLHSFHTFFFVFFFLTSFLFCTLFLIW